jgi:hypothetical protein
MGLKFCFFQWRLKMGFNSDPTNIPVQGAIFPYFEESNFSNTISLGIDLFRANPSLRTAIEQDQDAYGIEKKRLRLLDAQWYQDQMQVNEVNLFEASDKLQESSAKIRLSSTKARMDPELVFIFLLIRSYLGSIKAERSITFIKESKFIDILLGNYGLAKVPGASTILDQLNALSDKTTAMLLKASIKLASSELDIRKVYIDSTRISANSSWPTESTTISQLLTRISHSFSMLREDNILVNLPVTRQDLLGKILSAVKSIALDGGKKGSKKRREKRYKEIIKAARKLIKAFKAARSRIDSKIKTLKPSLLARVESIVELIEVDLHNVELCVENAHSRVIVGEQVPAESKVLGCADQDAQIIAKGETPLVFGYKPQIARSEQGFILAVVVPEGAKSDQSLAVPVVEEVIENIGNIPEAVSFDDGYTDKTVLKTLKQNGIGKVSFSGSRAKNLLPEEDYKSRDFQILRNERSMVESTMSQLKGFFDLERFSRRGLHGVTQELQGVATYHNLSLLAKLRKKANEKIAA